MAASAAPARPALLVSACLLGEPVRYDGGHKRDAFIAETLAGFFELTPICPEAEAGLGIPRTPVHLTGDPAAPRAVGVEDPARDVTDALDAHARQAAARHGGACGLVLKARSPSCAVHDAPRLGPDGNPVAEGPGLFTRAFHAALPLVPAADEQDLADADRREAFVRAVLALARWRRLLAEGLTPERLAAFHARHKLLLLVHRREAYRDLGGLVGRAAKYPAHTLAEMYGQGLMAAFAHPATRRRHADVLAHLLTDLTGRIDPAERARTEALIHDYRRGRVPRHVPMDRLAGHFARHPHPEAAGALYLYPEPAERELGCN